MNEMNEVKEINVCVYAYVVYVLNLVHPSEVGTHILMFYGLHAD